jgi:ABC-2 type transport system ATP-binding protein
MIRISNLSRHYNGFKAVDDVSFNIQKGEVVGLLGHNGAGKTSIMKMITGFLEPTSGSIELDRLCIGKNTIEIQEKIEYLPGNCPVWPEMVVLDYLQYLANLHGISEDLQKNIHCLCRPGVPRSSKRQQLPFRPYHAAIDNGLE